MQQRKAQHAVERGVKKFRKHYTFVEHMISGGFLAKNAGGGSDLLAVDLNKAGAPTAK